MRYCYHLWGTVERNFLNVNLWRKSRVNYLIPRVASIQFPLTISPLNHKEAVWLGRWSCDLVVSGSSPLALHPATHWICSRLPQVQFLGCTLYTWSIKYTYIQTIRVSRRNRIRAIQNVTIVLKKQNLFVSHLGNV